MACTVEVIKKCFQKRKKGSTLNGVYRCTVYPFLVERLSTVHPLTVRITRDTCKHSQRLHRGQTLAPKLTALFGNIQCRRPLLWLRLCKSAFRCSRKAYGRVEEKVGLALAQRTVERLNNERLNGEQRFSVSVPPFQRLDGERFWKRFLFTSTVCDKTEGSDWLKVT